MYEHDKFPLRGAGVLLAGCLLLTGCAGAPSGAAKVSGKTPTAAAAGAAASPTSAPLGAVPLTAAQAKASLLTRSDVPAGWKLGTFDRSESKDTTIPASCGRLMDSANESSGSLAEEGVLFDGATAGQTLTEEVTSFQPLAAVSLATMEGVLRQCATFTSVMADGMRVRFTVRPVAAPPAGDRSFAFQMRGVIQGGPTLMIDAVMVAVGHNGVCVLAGGLAPMNAKQFQAVTARAVQKLETASGATT